MNDPMPSILAPESRKKSMTSAHIRRDTCRDFISRTRPREDLSVLRMEIESEMDLSGQKAALFREVASTGLRTGVGVFSLRCTPLLFRTGVSLFMDPSVDRLSSFWSFW